MLDNVGGRTVAHKGGFIHNYRILCFCLPPPQLKSNHSSLLVTCYQLCGLIFKQNFRGLRNQTLILTDSIFSWLNSFHLHPDSLTTYQFVVVEGQVGHSLSAITNTLDFAERFFSHRRLRSEERHDMINMLTWLLWLILCGRNMKRRYVCKEEHRELFQAT